MLINNLKDLSNSEGEKSSQSCDLDEIDKKEENNIRETIKSRQSMIVVCEATAESEGVLMPDRPIGFPDLNYR